MCVSKVGELFSRKSHGCMTSSGKEIEPHREEREVMADKYACKH